ncbi:hypothetical protein DV735_g2892, partial [Chaetothyriales sp. CBS 134920]
MAATPAAEAEALLVSIREQHSLHPLSIERDQPGPQKVNTAASPDRPDDPSSSLLSPSSLALDLNHYRELFSKLRFSYLEQVSKEKYVRSIVGDPPVVVSAADNAAMEEKLAGMKQELKARKEANAQLVVEMEQVARAVAQRYDQVKAGMHTLETLPREIDALQAEVDALKQQRLNMSLADTEAALKESRAQNAELDREIERLQRQMPAKDRECKKAERDLDMLERRRNEVTAQATEARRIRAEGGRDYIGEKGKWYAAQETVMNGLLGIGQAS